MPASCSLPSRRRSSSKGAAIALKGIPVQLHDERSLRPEAVDELALGQIQQRPADGGHRDGVDDVCVGRGEAASGMDAEAGDLAPAGRAGSLTSSGPLGRGPSSHKAHAAR